MKNRRGLPSEEYWRERAEDRLTEAEKLSVPYLEDIHAIYDDARLKIVEDIKNLYKNCYKDNDGFDQEKLRVIIPNGDLERFHREMKKAGLSEYLPDNYKVRMTRLEYLYADCWAESKKASLKHQQIETKAHRETIQNAYYKTIYDTGVGLKVNPAFSKLDNRAVDQVLNTKFLGGNYSEKIWKNTDKLANTLKEVIGSAIARGESYSKTARGIRERFGVTQYEATRLVQTETCYFQNQAEIEALKTMGVEKYKFIATLDSRTSNICREHDKKIYNVEDAKAGENLPPLHPNPYQKGTKIWTKNGWIPVEDLKEGDLCWTITDEGDEPHLSPVIRTYHYNEPLIEFKNRSLTLRISPTHNMWAKYRGKDSSGYRFVEAQKIGNDNILYRGIGNKSTKTVSDELLAFIAFYAGDGTIHNNYVVICSTEHHDKILSQLSKLGKPTVLVDGRIGLSGGKMADLAREIGTHSTTKRLPKWIMELSRDSLRRFLDFYTICDGHIKKGKKWKNSQFGDEIVLFTTSEILRDDLIEVALRAGYKPSIRVRQPKNSIKKDGTIIKSNYPCFTISLGHRLHTFTGSLTRTMLPKQDCYCVELTDTHTLLVMTEGRIVWCGNCRSTVSAYLGEEYESAIRIARNENGENEYVDNVPYNEWLKRNDINIPIVSTVRQNKGIQDGLSSYNPNLLEDYSSILPEKAPDNIFEKIEPNQGVNQHEYTLTRAEIDFFNRLDSLNMNYKLIEATWEARNDFVMFGRNWELKTPIAENDSAIKYLFWRITDQGKRNAVIDVTYFNKDLSWIFNKIKEHLETVRKGEYDEKGKPITNNDLIDSILVVRGKKIIRYK